MVCERVMRVKSPKRMRSTTVRPTRSDARRRRATRSTSPMSTASRSAAVRGPRPSACCEPIERMRRPVTTGRGSRLLASAWRWWPEPRPSIPTSASRGSAATSPTRVMPRAWSFSAVRGPTPHSRSTGSGCRKSSSVPIGHLEQPVGLADRAGHLGQELGAGDAHADGQPDLGADPPPQLDGDLAGATRRCAGGR